MIAICPWCTETHASWGFPSGRPGAGEAAMCLKCGRWCFVLTTDKFTLRRADDGERAALRKTPDGVRLRHIYLHTRPGPESA